MDVIHVSYNESVVNYILFNMELSATARWEIGENAINDIDDGNDNDDHDLDQSPVRINSFGN